MVLTESLSTPAASAAVVARERISCAYFGKFLRRGWINQRTLAVKGDRVVWLGEEERNFCATFAGKSYGAFYGIAGKIGAVCWHKEMFEHNEPLGVSDGIIPL